jgi:hypothetical protein
LGSVTVAGLGTDVLLHPFLRKALDGDKRIDSSSRRFTLWGRKNNAVGCEAGRVQIQFGLFWVRRVHPPGNRNFMVWSSLIAWSGDVVLLVFALKTCHRILCP